MHLKETKRTILRAITANDLNALSQMMSDAEVMKYTGFRVPQSLEVIKEKISNWSKEGKGPLGVWAAEEKINQSFIGWFMLKETGLESPELGFMIAKEYWGKGYASEIALAVVEFSKDQGIHKIIARADKVNDASVSVLTKIGFKVNEERSNEAMMFFEIILK